MNTVTILGTNNMEITPDPVGSNASEIIPKKHIVAVVPVPYQERQPGDEEWTYPFNSITKLVFCLIDGRRLVQELQQVSNQPGWNDGSFAALSNASDDVEVWLNGGSLSPSPSVLVSPSSRTFADTVVNNFSAAQTIVVSGNNLTNNIVVTAPVGWIINQNGSTVNTGPITLVRVLGVVAPTTIYIRMAPTAVQSYDGMLVASSVGALSQNVSLIGSAETPVVMSSVPSLTFPETEVDLTSAPLSFNVSGTALHANLIITAPVGWIINQNGSSVDAGPISLAPNGAGVVASTTIYALFRPLVVGTNTGNITIASTDAVTQNVAVDGLALFPQNRVYSYYHNI